MRKNLLKAIQLGALCLSLTGCRGFIGSSSDEFWKEPPNPTGDVKLSSAERSGPQTVVTACYFPPDEGDPNRVLAAAVEPARTDSGGDPERGPRRMSQPMRAWFWWGFGR